MMMLTMAEDEVLSAILSQVSVMADPFVFCKVWLMTYCAVVKPSVCVIVNAVSTVSICTDPIRWWMSAGVVNTMKS